jgi:hypothetical protein
MMGFLSGSREAERRGRSADVERTWLLPGHRLPRRKFLTTPKDNQLFQKTSKMGLNSSKKRLFPCLLEGAVMSPPTAGIQGADSAVSLEKKQK